MKPHLVIIGLGNPGASHAQTRHNAGFRALDLLSKQFGEGPASAQPSHQLRPAGKATAGRDWKESQKFQCLLQEGRIITVPVLLAKPSTYMNRSGECIRKLVEFYKLNPREQILVISDDIDLPLGEVRLRRKGGPGTHNGLRSIVVVLGEEFPRIRIGLGTPPAGGDLSAWVLSVPPEEEQAKIEEGIAKLPDVVREFVMERVEE